MSLNPSKKDPRKTLCEKKAVTMLVVLCLQCFTGLKAHFATQTELCQVEATGSYVSGAHDWRQVKKGRKV